MKVKEPAGSPFDEFIQNRINDLLAKGYSKNYVFEGTVTSVGLGYEGKVVVIDPFDAHWVVLVESIKVIEGELPKLADDGRYAFLIHSPTRFFALTGTKERFFTMEGDGIRDRTSRFRFTYLVRKDPTKNGEDRELLAQYLGNK
jgi:hypothetical protein